MVAPTHNGQHTLNWTQNFYRCSQMYSRVRHIYEEKWLSALRHIKWTAHRAHTHSRLSRSLGSKAMAIEWVFYLPHIYRTLCKYRVPRVAFLRLLYTWSDNDDANARRHRQRRRRRRRQQQQQTMIALFSLFRHLWNGNNSQLDELSKYPKCFVCAAWPIVRPYNAYTHIRRSRAKIASVWYARSTLSSAQFT